MGSKRRRRLARRRLKAHEQGISDRHNKGMAWQAKQERKRVEIARMRNERAKNGAD